MVHIDDFAIVNEIRQKCSSSFSHVALDFICELRANRAIVWEKHERRYFPVGDRYVGITVQGEKLRITIKGSLNRFSAWKDVLGIQKDGWFLGFMLDDARKVGPAIACILAAKTEEEKKKIAADRKSAKKQQELVDLFKKMSPAQIKSVLEKGGYDIEDLLG